MKFKLNEATDSPPPKPSRDEIESLCILHVIALGPHNDVELATRLGLSAALAPAVGEAVQRLVDAGWVEGEPKHLTEAGRQRLAARKR